MTLDDQLNSKKIAISQDVIAVIDSSNPKVLKFFDVANGKPMNLQIDHSADIREFDLNNSELGVNRRVAFLDANKDLFISPIVKKDTVAAYNSRKRSCPCVMPLDGTKARTSWQQRPICECTAGTILRLSISTRS